MANIISSNHKLFKDDTINDFLKKSVVIARGLDIGSYDKLILNEDVFSIPQNTILKDSKDSSSPLTVALGKDIVGKAFVTDLKKLPHLLIAGTTGSGKSVGINAMILSLLYRNDPDQLNGSVEFELHESEQTEVILKILLYSGIIIRDPQIVQAAAAQVQADEVNKKS